MLSLRSNLDGFEKNDMQVRNYPSKTALLFWILSKTRVLGGGGRVGRCGGSPQFDLFSKNRLYYALLEFDCSIFLFFSMHCLTLKRNAKFVARFKTNSFKYSWRQATYT